MHGSIANLSIASISTEFHSIVSVALRYPDVSNIYPKDLKFYSCWFFLLGVCFVTFYGNVFLSVTYHVVFLLSRLLTICVFHIVSPYRHASRMSSSSASSVAHGSSLSLSGMSTSTEI